MVYVLAPLRLEDVRLRQQTDQPDQLVSGIRNVPVANAGMLELSVSNVRVDQHQQYREHRLTALRLVK